MTEPDEGAPDEAGRNGTEREAEPEETGRGAAERETERRALAEALRDTLAARGESAPIAPMRARPVLPRAVGGAAADTPPEDAPSAEIPADVAPDPREQASADSDSLEPASAEPTAPKPDVAAALAAAPADVTPRRSLVTRRGVVIGGRALAGIGSLALAAALVVAATVITEPRYSIIPPQTTVSPVAAAQQRVCPGPILRLGDDQGLGATSAASIGPPVARYRGSAGELTAEQLGQTDNTVGLAPLALTLPPTPGRSVSIAGGQSQSAASGDLVGFAAAQCAEPTGDTWLVGGSTDTGRTTLLTISNPTEVIANVEIDIFGPAGEVVAPGTDGIVIPPDTQRVFSLAGFAPQLAAPVVRVQSRGGRVVANLQQSVVRTLDPGGVDIVGASGAPALTTVIPGVAVTSSAAIAAVQEEAGYEDLPTAIRMFVPGESPARATVSLRPEIGSEGVVDDAALEAVPGATPASGGFEVELPPGQVTELVVPGLVDGTYTVTVASDAPIVAAARVNSLTEGGTSDLGWVASAEPLADETLVSTPPGPDPVLHLANPTDAPRTVVVVGARSTVTVDLAPGAAAATPLRAADDVTLTGAEGVRATVTYSDAGQVAAFGITSPGPASRDIVVYR